MSIARTFVTRMRQIAGQRDLTPWTEYKLSQLSEVEKYQLQQDWIRDMLEGQAQAEAQDADIYPQVTALMTELSGKQYAQDASFIIFPDHSAALHLDVPQHYQKAAGSHWLYWPLEWYEFEQETEQRGYLPRRDLYVGQVPVHADVAWLYMRSVRAELTNKAVTGEYLAHGVLKPSFDGLEVHGVLASRGLIQVSAWVDARTWAEIDEDEAEAKRREAMTAEEQQAEADLAWRDLSVQPVPRLTQATAQARLRRWKRGKERAHLTEGKYVRVGFHAAFVEKPGSGPQLFIVHRFLNPELDAVNMQLAELARIERRRLSGEKQWWQHDTRDWFSGRKGAVSPYSPVY